MLHYIRKVMSDSRERGASAVEYGLMVAAIAALIVGVVFALGGVVSGIFRDSCQNISRSATTAGCETPPAPPAGGAGGD